MVHTGQHFDADMSDIFFDELDIPKPQHHLAIHGGGHGDMTGRMLMAIEPIMHMEKPDWVVVYGDTNSTLAGALAASKLHIPVAHVEAGLRSFNRRMPEEINRVVTDHLSALHLCPTTTAVANLAAEGIVSGVHHVGDVMYDATLFAIARRKRARRYLTSSDSSPKTYALATVHRAENTDDPHQLRAVVEFLQEGAEASRGLAAASAHPQAARRWAWSSTACRSSSRLAISTWRSCCSTPLEVYTDSGGLQKEAYFHRVPCITLRDETEWTETVEHGWNRLWKGPEQPTGGTSATMGTAAPP